MPPKFRSVNDRLLLLTALMLYDGNRNAAAVALGVNPTTVFEALKYHTLKDEAEVDRVMGEEWLKDKGTNQSPHVLDVVLGS